MKKLVIAILMIASVAHGQFGGPLMKNNGTQVIPAAPFWNFVGVVPGDVVCAYDAATASDKCTFNGGGGATLQSAYNGSAGANPSILLTAGNAAVSIQAPGAAMGSLFRIRQTGAGADLVTVTDNGTNVFDSTGALNLGVTNATGVSIGGVNAATTSGSLIAVRGVGNVTIVDVRDGNSADDIRMQSSAGGGAAFVGYNTSGGGLDSSLYRSAAATLNVGTGGASGTGTLVANIGFATNGTLSGTTGAANALGFSWTETGAQGGIAAGGAAAGIGGTITRTGGTGGAAIAGAGNTAAAGGPVTERGGTGGAAAGANNAASGGAESVIGGTGGAAAGGLTNGAGGPVNVTGGAAGGGAGVGNSGGAANVTGGAATGSGNQNGGAVVLTGGAKANSGVNGDIEIAGQNLFLLGVYTTAQLPAACTNGQIVWDSTTTQVKFCLANVFAPFESASDFNFSAFDSLTSTTLIAPLAKTTVTNAATIRHAAFVVEVAGSGGAGNYVERLCQTSDCSNANDPYVTCTTACAGQSAGQVTDCTINRAGVAAGLTMFWQGGTACVTTNPAFNVNAHFTNP